VYKKILVPVDGSEQSTYTLKEAIRLASDFGKDVHLTVLHVTLPILLNDFTISMDVNQVRAEEARSVLSAVEPLFSNAAFQHESLFVDGDPAQMICQKAQSGSYDLIVIGSRGHGLFRELLLGSVSHKVVQHAHCPVLVIRR
jgi:nucleotide-binding universal stress UspA family protein